MNDLLQLYALAQRTGLKSTEFWAVALGFLLSFVAALNPATAAAWSASHGWIGVVATMVYALLRTVIKVQATNVVGALAATSAATTVATALAAATTPAAPPLSPAPAS